MRALFSHSGADCIAVIPQAQPRDGARLSYANKLWKDAALSKETHNSLPAEIRLEQQGSMALVTLDRPRALNALTVNMRAELDRWFTGFPRDPQVYAVVLQSTSPKAFSVGSDVREVTALGRTDQEAARQTFRDEYALNWRLECFSKPTVSLIDGMVMGGGVGISLYGTHRVAGEGYRFAMPETRIGLFPDVGVCQVFARMPGSIGQYLGLTGRGIGRAEAYALGLVTHCIPARAFDEIKTGLAATMPVDPLLDDRHEDPGPGELETVRDVIARCFSAPDVPGILSALEAEQGTHREWANEVAAELRSHSPLSLAVTHRHIATAARKDLREVLLTDYRLACHFLKGLDFYEGVRAVVIDKDGRPKWAPPCLEAVTADLVEGYFAPLPDDSWVLPKREEMQASRA